MITVSIRYAQIKRPHMANSVGPKGRFSQMRPRLVQGSASGVCCLKMSKSRENRGKRRYVPKVSHNHNGMLKSGANSRQDSNRHGMLMIMGTCITLTMGCINQ